MAKEELNTFQQFIATLEDGDLVAEINEKLGEMLEKLNQHKLEYGGNPKGSITLKLDFLATRGVIEINAKLETKTPAAPRGSTHLWSTKDNRFSTANPKQRKLPLEVVDEETGEIHAV